MNGKWRAVCGGLNLCNEGLLHDVEAALVNLLEDDAQLVGVGLQLAHELVVGRFRLDVEFFRLLVFKRVLRDLVLEIFFD